MFFSKFAESTGLFDLLAPIIPRSRNNGQEQEGQSASKKNKVDHEQIKRRQLDSQRKSEEVAESKGLFAKKQRVRYHNKTTDVVCDAVVVGVHFDDGPQHPYYVSTSSIDV